MDRADVLRSKFRKSVKPSAQPSIFDMISSGMKHQFNLTNPENGIKGYNMPDPNQEDWNYKVSHVGKMSNGQEKFKAGYIHDYLKAHAYIPGAKDVKYLHAWG